MELEDLESDHFSAKVCYVLRKIGGIISFQPKENYMICYVPPFAGVWSKVLEKKLYHRLCEILYQKSVQKMVLSQNLQKNKKLVHLLEGENYTILHGQELFQALIFEVIDYIARTRNENSSSYEVTILMNQCNTEREKLIVKLAKEVQTLHIVTLHVERFHPIQHHLLEHYGIYIRLSNHKKKSLWQAGLIFNFDFPEEILNTFHLKEQAILIQLGGKVNITKKRFQGCNVQDYAISVVPAIQEKFKTEHLEKQFKLNEWYEGLWMAKGNTWTKWEAIQEDNIKIQYLIGKNGILTKNDIKSIDKI